MHICDTSRLLIRELVVEDAPFILQLTNSEGWLQYIGDRGIRQLADAENYIVTGPQASYRQWQHGLYLLQLKQEGTPIGICGLLQRDYLPYKDIGFALLPDYNGKGYALEAAAAIIAHSKKLLGIEKFAAITLPHNTRSIQLLQKLGMLFDKHITAPGGKEELMLFIGAA
ncbi:MAG TPA: GNAT family N-acetyltransferase [Chitinophagaceae bacterium]|nr:GNAT family N-acetyltransferase [Chitinophagaceae bacterium]